MANKEDKLDIRNAKRTANAMRKGGLRLSNSAAVQFNQQSKAQVKAGKPGEWWSVKVKSSGYKPAKTNSATKPSMPVKQGVKNKMKAQGAKSMSSPTSGYGKSTKPKGR